MEAWIQTVGALLTLVLGKRTGSKHCATFTSVPSKMVECLTDISWDGLRSSREMIGVLISKELRHTFSVGKMAE